MFQKALLILLGTTVVACLGLLAFSLSPANQAPQVDSEPVTVRPSSTQPSERTTASPTTTSSPSPKTTASPTAGTTTSQAPTAASPEPTPPAPAAPAAPQAPAQPAQPPQQVVIQPTPEVRYYNNAPPVGDDDLDDAPDADDDIDDD
ncbi:hypothetical protein VVR12_08655 [Rothia sp. LK2588]|uniref:hypothetical protein n=1 Tax=Rothia sp. LK2588 TaxID=3114369 RepID=UPI0034CD6719